MSRRRKILLAAVVAVVAFLAYRISGGLEDLDLEQLLDDVANGLGPWTYLLVGAMAFLETGAFVGLVAPGEVSVILGGAVAGRGAIDVFLMLAITWVAAFLGDTVSFSLGRRLGRSFVLRHGEKVRITPARLRQVERYFERHGGKTILIGRFAGLVRALAPFIAGSSGMRYGSFAPYSILGTGLWAATFTLLGYFLSSNIELAKEIAGKGAFAIGTVIFVVVGTIVAVHLLREPENRSRAAGWMAGRPGFRQLLSAGRRLAPQARFLWNRVTPGGLGLEVTTLVAALVVALYVLIAYAVTLSGDPGPTPGDARALEVARDLHAGWLADVAEVITRLGAPGLVISLGAVTGVWLAYRRAWAELAVLAAGLAICLASVDTIKALVDRPRPGDGLVETSGSSYPSGHATYSVFYVWLAWTVLLKVRRALPWRTAILTVGLVAALLIGASRVYLQVHRLSDVAGGWALGVSAFAVAALVAVLVTHLRHNRPDARGIRP